MTTMTTDRYLELADRYSAHNYHPLPVVIERARGVWVWDPEGNRYLDMLAAYSAVNQGHCHPVILEALRSQAERVTLTSRAFHNDRFGPLCELLCEMTGFEKVLLMNTGAEAVETAIKAARKWGYQIKGVKKDKAEIIVCSDNFHGRTTTIVGFSTEDQYKDGFGPFTPGFKVIPFGDAKALEEAITPNTVAFMCEPIQGEAGIIIPKKGFLKKAAALCKKNNVLLICDEIQSGLGRTGKLFAHQWEGVRPDGVIIGKALSGGFYPVSAFLADDEVMGVFRPGDHGSTFGGNPLGCIVAREALQVLVDEKLIENSLKQGEYFMEKLKGVKAKSIEKVRGIGLWIGVVLDRPARPYCEALMEAGMLCKETHSNIIRIAPPLTIQRKDINWAMKRIEKVFKELG